MTKSYRIEIDCANCANKVEAAVNATAGIKTATVNYMTQKMNVEFEENADIAAVMAQVVKNSKRVESDCEIYI